MLRTDFKCCWYLQEKLRSCSDKKRADLRYLPKRPVLTVESSYYLSIGDHVTATCSACVGTGGQLVWALDRLPKTFQWSSDFESTQDSPPSPGGLGIIPQTTWLFEDRNGTNISWSVIEDSVCGPYINSTFERLVGNDLHGAVLVCFTSNPDTISVSKAEVTVRSSVFSVNGYKDPVWTDKIGLRLVLLLVGLFILPLCGIFLFFGAPCGKNQPGRPWRRLRMRNYRAGYPKGKDASKQARPKECIKVPPQMSCPRALSKTQKPSNDKAVVTSKLGDKRKQSANSKHSGKSSKSSGFSEGSDEKDEESM
ncbi:hypothetical protein EGW08_023045 [Elysia chlorotica]|uniref:Ig-like domain-containing protein n=1 Tax=Elysia chlorotica TaxID=188477 RepID=A0A433SJF4_ELYCH|nr:hypothetical protein EGW08_023045 [Elysia chlorotica]